MIDTILVGDATNTLKTLADKSVNCVVTSPPYFNLRDYGIDGQIGLDDTPQAYIARLIAVFDEIKRVLRDDGTVWVNLGDTYGTGTKAPRQQGSRGLGFNQQFAQDAVARAGGEAKQLLGIPWRFAFAMQDSGWILRSDIIWHKPSCMPESVKDRPTKAHEYLFLFAKQGRYYYDHEAIAEKITYNVVNLNTPKNANTQQNPSTYILGANANLTSRNKRTVWSITHEGYNGAHFATMPIELAKNCVLAGCPKDGIVMDPFMGAGTVGLVAKRLDRHYVGIELNPSYAQLAQERINQDNPFKAKITTDNLQLSLFG
jgi:DNA modification methylase